MDFARHWARRGGSCLRLIALAGVLLAHSEFGGASESDPWTYAHIPLADSGALVSERLVVSIQSAIERVNTGQPSSPRMLGDTELEFAFFAEFRSLYIRDVTWGQFELCIGTNDCPGWPRFERIQMFPAESVYHAARWRFIPARFHLASIVNVCGIRMGADKLTHFFDDGFHYFNALRSRRKNLDPEDIRNLSLAFERSYMGTRITGIVSRADIEANLAGVEFYSDFFSGDAPIIGRGPDGRLLMLRNPDVCDYVTRQFDERILPNEYSYGLLSTDRAEMRARNLLRLIDRRARRAARLARELDGQELARQKSRLLARRIPMTRWQSDFPKIRLVTYGAGMVSQWLFDRDFRRAVNLFGFNPLKADRLGDRKPVEIVLSGA
ncbi:MAG: hypothetical protein OEN02_02780 [Gammaproteobacteria bacterium]|nr:hypothetical protein [Gammaproteobacteria bacterium]